MDEDDAMEDDEDDAEDEVVVTDGSVLVFPAARIAFRFWVQVFRLALQCVTYIAMDGIARSVKSKRGFTNV